MSNRRGMISRRAVLRGLGASVALPWLEAMVPSAAGANVAAAPVRMAVLFMPNGVHPEMWTPKGEGRDYQLSPTLEPLASVKKDVLLLTNLRNEGSLGGDGHYVKSAGFLTGTTIAKTTGRDLNSGGVSMDQMASRKIGSLTPLPSLELGIQPTARGIDANVGYTQLYGSHISWRTETMPLMKENVPRKVFRRMFRDPADTAADRAVLDIVAEDAKRLRRKIGVSDRFKFDEYLDSLHSLEMRIDAAENREAESRHLPEGVEEPEEGIPKSHQEHVRLMLDLIVLAFRTDTTRISTFMFGNSVSGIDFSFLDGVSGGHHQLSHHQNEEDKLRQYQIINRWHVAELVRMVEKMRAIPEGEGTLLDNSMVLFGSSLRDGNKHDPNNLPIILAGRAGGQLDTGRHIVYPEHTPLCNLYSSMLRRVGAPVKRFGDSTQELKLLG